MILRCCMLLFVSVACARSADEPPVGRSPTLEALADSLGRLVGPRAQKEVCSAGQSLIDHQRREVVHPLGACVTDLRDTVFYTYSSVDGRVRLVGQHYYVPPARFVHATDSAIAALSRAYGPGVECPPDPPGGPYIARYHRWAFSTYDVQLIANNMELAGAYPAIVIEAQSIAAVCGQWTGRPYPH